MMAREIHISSVVVHGAADRLDAISTAIERLPGVEVHASDPAGKLIVTIESDEEAGIAERLDAIRALDAVYTASLVYHHVEDVEDLDSEVLR